MYFSEASRVLLRRWLIVVIGLALTVGAGIALVSVTETRYQASGQVLLLPPSNQVEIGDPVNPYLNLPSALTFTASLVASAMTTPDAARALALDGFVADYSVSVVPGNGPLIVISVEDTDPSVAIKTRDELVAQINSEVEEIQLREDVPTDQMIVARPFSTSSQAEVLAGAKIRALAVVSALGLVVTVLAAFAYDRAAVSRRRSKRDRNMPPPDRENVPPPDRDEDRDRNVENRESVDDRSPQSGPGTESDRLLSPAPAAVFERAGDAGIAASVPTRSVWRDRGSD